MSWVPVTRAVIDQLTRCRVIARFGIGVDMIDLDAATERGILVCNTATYCLDEVSSHAITLLLMLNRGLLQDIDAVRPGGWVRENTIRPRRLAGQRLGLLGAGTIGGSWPERQKAWDSMWSHTTRTCCIRRLRLKVRLWLIWKSCSARASWPC